MALEFFYSIYDINYLKTRCPLCLKYKCIYCNKSSTLISSLCCPYQAFFSFYNSGIKEYKSDFNYYILIIPIIRVWTYGFMMNFPFYRGITKTNNLLKEKKEIKRRIQLGTPEGVVCGVYQCLMEDNCKFYINIFHISGSILWTIPYLMFFEFILSIFFLFDKILRKNNYKKLIDCFHLFIFIPGLNRSYGHLEEI